MDIAIVRVYCVFCRRFGVGEANLELRSDRFGRKPSVCKRCWDSQAKIGSKEYWDIPNTDRYENGEDIPRDTNTR